MLHHLQLDSCINALGADIHALNLVHESNDFSRAGNLMA